LLSAKGLLELRGRISYGDRPRRARRGNWSRTNHAGTQWRSRAIGQVGHDLRGVRQHPGRLNGSWGERWSPSQICVAIGFVLAAALGLSPTGSQSSPPMTRARGMLGPASRTEIQGPCRGRPVRAIRDAQTSNFRL
jgi:hypothetical protein